MSTGPRPGARYRTYPAPDRKWADRAACKGMAPAFDSALPKEKPAETDARVVDALAVCRGCVVRMACRAWTMAQPRGDRQGVMGGEWWSIVQPYRRKPKDAA